MTLRKTPTRILELARRLQEDNITDSEHAEFEKWYESFDDSVFPDLSEETPDQLKKRMLDEILKKKKNRSQWLVARILYFGYKINLAAAVLIMVSVGAYFYLKQPSTVKNKNIVHYKKDFAPGGNKAILTLSNGKKIDLNDAKQGALAQQGSTIVNKTQEGHLTYNSAANSTGTDKADLFNTVTTPKGGQYQISLPDGTKVWLNAASSIRFPLVFNNNERRVEISGEVYFEVTKNKALPFRVISNSQIVEVLGTHFNISAYEDEKATATTLLEGAVKVTLSSNHKSALIKPGEQSVVNHTDLNVQRVDTDEAVAWKNGYFQFNDENLESIMRKISRWYDVQIEYKGNIIHSRVLSGTVSRYENVSQVIKILELENAANFKIEGNKIVVTK